MCRELPRDDVTEGQRLGSDRCRGFGGIREHSWRDRFDGPKYVKGHALTEGSSWNDDLLPELYELEKTVGQEAGCRLIIARGLARLSPWFGFGYVFSEV